MSIIKRIKKTAKNQEKGASLVEYALLVALIAAVSISAIRAMSNKISQSFSHTGSAV